MGDEKRKKVKQGELYYCRQSDGETFAWLICYANSVGTFFIYNNQLEYSDVGGSREIGGSWELATGPKEAHNLIRKIFELM